jgi:hypothetical protein
MDHDELRKLADGWPTCDFWSDDEGTERLVHSDLLEALEEAVDARFVKGQGIEDCVLENFSDGITMYGWTRKEVGDSDVMRLCDAAVDAVTEAMGNDLELFDPEEEDVDKGELPRLFEAAIREDLKGRDVWACERTHEVVLTPEQLLGILRLEFGDWFEGGEGA